MTDNTQVVSLHHGEPRTTTIELAKGFNIQHKNIIALVRTYQSDLAEFGRVAFETRMGKSLPQGGFAKATEVAILNEEQSALIMTYLKNTPDARQFKKTLVKEFYRMKQALLNQMNLSWKQQRLDGKEARRLETDSIARFVEYATAQGSQSAKMYFMQITKMTHQALFLVKQASPKPFRDLLDSMQLSFLTTAEHIVRSALEDGMTFGLHYKDIYQAARERVTAYAATLPQQRLLKAA